MTSPRPVIDEVLALDVRVLRAPDGGLLDPVTHRAALNTSIARADWALVRRQGQLIAYGYLWPLEGTTWFVGGLAIDPDYRNAPTIAALGRSMSALIARTGAQRLKSHVLRTNAASLRLHRRFGFEIETEDERAIAFAIDVADLLRRLPVDRLKIVLPGITAC